MVRAGPLLELSHILHAHAQALGVVGGRSQHTCAREGGPWEEGRVGAEGRGTRQRHVWQLRVLQRCNALAWHGVLVIRGLAWAQTKLAASETTIYSPEVCNSILYNR